MNPILSGIAAIVIFSFGTLLFALGQSIPNFQFAAIFIILGALIANGQPLVKMLSKRRGTQQ